MEAVIIVTSALFIVVAVLPIGTAYLFRAWRADRRWIWPVLIFLWIAFWMLLVAAIDPNTR